MEEANNATNTRETQDTNQRLEILENMIKYYGNCQRNITTAPAQP